MKILLTGATGYIGKRLLPVLIEQEHEIYACTRDNDRDHKKKRLLLYAEMILPCYAWLEFKIVKENGKDVLKQTATFRPEGLLGRLYWYSVLPFHWFIFDGMIDNIVEFRG